jgi:hypothetical protein
MSKKLKAFMVRLATDQDLLNDFIANAAQSMAANSLSAEDQEILSSGDTSRIYLALIGEKGALQAASASSSAAQPKQQSVLPSVVPVISAIPWQHAAGYAGSTASSPSQAAYWQHYWNPWSAMAGQPQAGAGSYPSSCAEASPASVPPPGLPEKAAVSHATRRPRRTRKPKKKKGTEPRRKREASPDSGPSSEA